MLSFKSVFLSEIIGYVLESRIGMTVEAQILQADLRGLFVRMGVVQ